MEDRYFIIRGIYNPEVILARGMNLEELLSKYEGKTVGLVKARNLKKETRGGKQYYEGRLTIHNTVDDKGNPVKAYYVEQNGGLLVPIDLGDGLFFDHLPTQPKEWSPRYN